MKQGKDNSRVDLGWERMQPILNKELPIQKSRKRFLWVWLFSTAALLGVIGYYSTSGDNTPKALEEKPQPVVTKEIVGVDTKARTNTEIASSDEATHKRQATSSDSSTASENSDSKTDEKTIVTTNRKVNSPVKSKNFIAQNKIAKTLPLADHNRTSTTTTTQTKSDLVKVEYNTIGTTNNLTAPTSIQPGHAHSKTIIPTTTAELQTLRTISQLQRPIAFLSSKNERSLSFLPSMNFREQEEEVLPKPITHPVNHNLKLNVAGFYASSFPSVGSEINLSYGLQRGKFDLGITAGPGYYFDGLISTDETQDEINASDPNAGFNVPTGDTMSNGNMQGGLLGGAPLSIQWYLNGGLYTEYQLSKKLSIRYQFGVEKHKIRNLDKLEEFNNRGASPTPIIAEGANADLTEQITYDNTDWLVYHQAGIQYKLGSKFALSLSYRSGHKFIFATDNKSYKAHKLLFNIAYQL